MKKKGRLKFDKDGKKIPKIRREVDPVGMVSIFRDLNPDHIFLELVASRSGQGVVSMFSFGRSFGDVRTAGAWLGCPITLVRPQDWQKVMFEGMKTGGSKQLSADVATKLWPEIDLRKSKRSRKIHDGLSDAACIAKYGLRQLSEGFNI